MVYRIYAEKKPEQMIRKIIARTDLKYYMLRLGGIRCRLERETEIS